MLKKLFHRKKTPKDSSVPPQVAERAATNTHLVVDDSQTNRFVLASYLRMHNMNSVEANNGQAAIDIILQEPDRFDVVWVDVKMPIMNGITMTQILRKKHNYGQYIVGVTGCVDHATRQQCHNAGMNAVLAKPLDPDSVTHILHHVVGHSGE